MGLAGSKIRWVLSSSHGGSDGKAIIEMSQLFPEHECTGSACYPTYREVPDLREDLASSVISGKKSLDKVRSKKFAL
jgi:hypothetical protein